MNVMMYVLFISFLKFLCEKKSGKFNCIPKPITTRVAILTAVFLAPYRVILTGQTSTF